MQKSIDIETKFAKSRSNLLLVVAFSAVNVILLLINSGTYFLFSAAFPIFSVELGQILSQELGISAYYTIGIVVAFLAIAFYGICYLLSKRYKAFILVAFIGFVIDTILLIWFSILEIDISMIIDIIIHAWVIYYLVIGVRAWLGLRKATTDDDIAKTQEYH